MTTYLIRRAFVTLGVLYLIATLAFFFPRLLPGDPVLLLLGEAGSTASEETIIALRQKLGLDKPIAKQYATWLIDIVHGNFGESLFGYGQIQKLLFSRLPNSLELILFSLALACLLAIPSGILAAYFRRSKIDLAVNLLSTVGIAVPVYVLAVILILIFALKLRYFPAGGYIALGSNPIEHFKYLLLPVFTLALNQWALFARMTRSSVLEVLHEGYIQTARAKGLAESKVVMQHALRNALIPIVTLIGLQIGRLLGATVLVESIFNWPGISSLLLESATRRDYPIIQALLVVIGALVCLINYVVDITYGLLDPRIRYD